MDKSNTTPKKATEENIKYCYLCGRQIYGEYDYIKTNGGTEMYFCKGMRCGNPKEGADE